MSEYKTIKEREEEIIEEFSLFDEWEEKYEYIIDLGKKLEPLINTGISSRISFFP